MVMADPTQRYATVASISALFGLAKRGYDSLLKIKDMKTLEKLAEEGANFSFNSDSGFVNEAYSNSARMVINDIANHSYLVPAALGFEIGFGRNEPAGYAALEAGADVLSGVAGFTVGYHSIDIAVKLVQGVGKGISFGVSKLGLKKFTDYRSYHNTDRH